MRQSLFTNGWTVLGLLVVLATAAVYVMGELLPGAISRGSAAVQADGQGRASDTVPEPEKPRSSPSPAEKPFQGDPLNKPVLKQSGFTFLGAFDMPIRDGKNWSTAFSTAPLTHRYVQGKLQFLSASHNYGGGLIYETNYPGLGAGNRIPEAKVVHYWGDVYQGHKWVLNDGGSNTLGGGVVQYGLYYDQERNRLYWNYGHWFNATHPFNPSFGFSTLDDTTGMATGVGCWGLKRRPEKFTRGGTMRLPKWFADRYTGGKSLGVGNGGYFSIVAAASFGPALAAVADPDIKVSPEKSALDNIPLIGYPGDAPDRGHRDPDYTSFYDGGTFPKTPGHWNPKGGVGYWTWSDIIFGSATWIDMPGAHGVLFIAKVGQGKVWYEKSDRHAERGVYEWFIYDPKDLAAVARGAKQQWQIQPKSHWIDSVLPKYPEGWGGDGFSCAGGATFDSTTNRLYVSVAHVRPSGLERHPRIYVYQVGG